MNESYEVSIAGRHERPRHYDDSLYTGLDVDPSRSVAPHWSWEMQSNVVPGNSSYSVDAAPPPVVDSIIVASNGIADQVTTVVEQVEEPIVIEEKKESGKAPIDFDPAGE